MALDDDATAAPHRVPAARAARLAAAIVLAAASLGIALAAGHARRLAATLRAQATDVGGSPAAVADPSDAAPFAPFAFGVVGPAHGDATLLARAVEALAARGDVDFVVLVGDVTADGGDDEGMRLAAAVRGRGVPVVAVGGEGDVGPRRETFQRWLGAPRWWFRHRGCVVVGLPGVGDGTAADATFLRDRLAGAKPARTTIVVTASDAPTVAVASLAEAVVFGGSPVPAVRVVRVGADGGVTSDALDVPTGPTLRTLARDVTLRAVHPVVRTNVGYYAVLAVAALLLVASFRVVRPRR